MISKRLLLFLPMVLAGCGNPNHQYMGPIVKSEAIEKLQKAAQPYFKNPENIDYNVIKNLVLAKNCMGCHSTDSNNYDWDAVRYSANMTTYQTLFDEELTLIIKGKPEESKLFRSTAIRQSMPPAKAGYVPLDGVSLKLIRLWILNCAIEDKAALKDEILEPNPKTPDKVRICPE